MIPGDGNTQLQHHACNKRMACEAKKTHLDKFIKPDPLDPYDVSKSTHGLATGVEAIVGAVWIDSERQREAVESVMTRLNLYPD